MKIPHIQHPSPRARQRYEALLKLMQVADKMSQVGFRVDREAIARHAAVAQQNKLDFTARFLQHTQLPPEALGDAGAGQAKAVRDWFLLTCNAPVVSRDKLTKKPQVNTDALITYATKYKHTAYGPAAAALYGLRKNIKSIQFCHAYEVLSRADSRIHASFFPFGTKTGRWSSSAKLWCPDTMSTVGCNLQQIPSKTPCFEFEPGVQTQLVESLRDCFIADPGCKIYSWDYSALEVRLIAYIFGITRMIEAIESADAKQGPDVHVFTAKHLFSDVFGKFPEKLLRNNAKQCSYAITYMMHDPKGRAQGYKTMQRKLREDMPDIDDTATKLIVDRFFALYPEVKARQLEVQKQIASQGYREIPINGRRLHYPDSMRGWNQALNATFQATGAELINRAVLKVAPQCVWKPGGFYIAAQCHDEIVANVPEEQAEVIDEAVRAAMSAPADLGGGYQVSIPSQAAVGDCWPK